MKKLIQKIPFLAVCLLAAFLAFAGQAWAVGGPVIISGDDADDSGHCQFSDCGQLYGKALNFVVTNSNSPGTGILAIGVNSSRALTGFNSWNDPANGGPGAVVTHARTTTEIATAVLSTYAAIYIPSNDNNTSGGITASQLTTLNTRQADITDFVNNLGGGLMALTEAGDVAKYGWLPLPLTDINVSHIGDIFPTADMSIIAPGITPADLDHGCCYHTAFTGPPGFSGLKVLAYHDDNLNGTFDGEATDHVLILGGVQVTIQGNISLTPATALLGTGDTHTVTATAEDGDPLAPAVGVTVTFVVSAGPNAGATGSCNNAGCTTDASGQVSFSYVGNNVGTDSIVASFVDANTNTQTSNTVEAEWELRNQPPDADAGPDQTVVPTSPAGTNVTLDGSGSTDPDGDTLTYAWSGPFGTATGVSPTVLIPPGTHTVTLTVDDGNGATDTDTMTVSNKYTFCGFEPPVDNLPVLNAGRAGQTIPAKWCVLDATGGFISDLAIISSIQTQERTCPDAGPVSEMPAEDADATGSTTLRYVDDHFIFNWKTSKDMAGHCYTLNLNLNDGSLHQALFELR